MADYQLRVVEERDDLNGKIERLTKFLDTPIYNSLPVPEKDRLVAQLRVMNEYLKILDARIDNF